MEIVLVGGDALALRVCEDLCAHGHAVTVLWDEDSELARRVGELGARYVGKSPEEASFPARGRRGARGNSVMALSIEDHRNVQVMLRSRDLNADIRLVLRQFNRELGRKIEQNLPNCSVLSRSTHAAATYAAAAVDPYCFYAMQFPDIDGVLVGFSRVRAEDAGVAGLTVGEAEQRLDARILAVDDAPADMGCKPAPGAELMVFRVVRPSNGRAVRRGGGIGGEVARSGRPRMAVVAAFGPGGARRDRGGGGNRGVRHDLFLGAFGVGRFYRGVFRGDDDDHHRLRRHHAACGVDFAARAVAMALMVSGVAFSGMFVAIVAARLTHAQWVSLHGVRKIYRRGHFVVCGAGQVGSCVIDFLLGMKQRVVVIEANPTSAITERSRERHFDLLTGDATDSEVLALCNIERARGLIALTESDTMNLETALSARAHNASLPVVMRVTEVGLADSIKRHFGLDRTFGTAALSAPAFAGLAFHGGSRGRIMIGGKEYAISEREAHDFSPKGGAGEGVPLCVRRNGVVTPVREARDVQAGDRVLLLYPLHPRAVIGLVYTIGRWTSVIRSRSGTSETRFR